MSARDPHSLQSEPTPEGEQTLIPGVRPVTTRDRLSLLMEATMRPRAAQKPLDIGLFDEAQRNQLDLF
ncbi:hypothetical protein FJW06_15440 [Mesorhizobium sp. B4-1-3]|uniref:hypothetical protein n=1 Tax=Mesorhizobium sp. B4-1-3 TaxID=2589889 RepID=UPI0011284663|nr:hypothetical protein [Mesorhizobium sp. B4-1-3]TPI13045.1 hypothetical protein FJW06_15440 [Mesorhizobium sp. B4-1-3]